MLIHVDPRARYLIILLISNWSWPIILFPDIKEIEVNNQLVEKEKEKKKT